MNAKRALLLAAAVLVLVVGGAFAWLMLSLDGMVAREIERAGTEVTGTDVRVAGVDVSLKEASGHIRSLRVANPKGFGPAAVFEAGAIRFSLDPKTLRSDVLVIDEVVVSSPRVRLEFAAGGQSNVDVLAGHAAGRKADEDAGPPRKIRIGRFLIEDAILDADASALNGRIESLPLRDIKLTRVGGRSGGTGEEIAAEIVTALRREIVRAAAREGLHRALSGQEAGAKDKVRKTIEGLFGR